MEVPFIKLFHSPNAGYFLDVNKNEILQVSEDSFEYLNAVLTHKKDNLTISDELIELKKEGYLTTESVVKEVRHPFSNYLDTFLDRKVGKITLQLTQLCNFRCKYCIYSEDHNNRQRSHSI